jgi:hypothetical protein
MPLLHPAVAAADTTRILTSFPLELQSLTHALRVLLGLPFPFTVQY